MSRDREPWWAVARSEEVTAKKPLAVHVGEEPVVLWRDAAGVARALEDRCPHRRAPLSLGCIRENGWLQCGYHGWSYDGETGRLKEIPNMKDRQRFPPVYKARAFAVREDAGFVRVCLDAAAEPPAFGGDAYPGGGMAIVGLEHRHWLDALHDDPGLVIAIRGISFSPYLFSELRARDGLLEMERNCQWAPVHFPAPFTAEFPVTLLTRTHPTTGETRVTLRDTRRRALLHAAIAPIPGPRGTTAIRWRAAQGVRHPGLRGAVLRGPNPFTVLSSIDGVRLQATKPTVSIHGDALRAQLLRDPAASGRPVALETAA